MNLPDLPKKVIKREAKFITTQFAHRIPTSLTSCPLEFKQTTSYSFPFIGLPPHQSIALFKCTTPEGFFYKISDDSRGKKPFDGFFFRNSPAYVVIKFPDLFVGIEIRDFIRERDILGKRKSLTQKRALEIASFEHGV